MHWAMKTRRYITKRLQKYKKRLGSLAVCFPSSPNYGRYRIHNSKYNQGSDPCARWMTQGEDRPHSYRRRTNSGGNCLFPRPLGVSLSSAMDSAQGPLSHSALVSLARSIVLQPSLGPISPGDIFYYSGTFCFLFPHHMLNLLLRAIFYASFVRLRAFEFSCNRGCYCFSCVPSPFSSSRHLYLVLLLLVLTLTPFLLPGLHLCLPSCATSHPVHSLLKCFTTYDLRFAVRGEVVVIISIG